MKTQLCPHCHGTGRAPSSDGRTKDTVVKQIGLEKLVNLLPSA